jgi:tetratricopeptide (TPR) repeat protein
MPSKNLSFCSISSLFFASLAALLLAACAPIQTNQQDPSAQTEPAAIAEQSLPTPAAAMEAPEPALPKGPDLPNNDLDAQTLYELLVAEVAAQRGNIALATQAYLDLSRRTRDPRVAKRATEVALFGRNAAAATEAATIWLETDPTSLQAAQSLTGILVNSNQLEKVKPVIARILVADGDNRGASILQLPRLLSRVPDRAAALKLTQDLVEPYQKMPESHLVIAQTALSAQNETLALAEVRAAVALRPQWELAALLEAQILQHQSDTAAVAKLREYLKTNPRAREARMTLARLLVSDKLYPEARAEFETLKQLFPGDADIIFAVGILSLQLNDLDVAEANLRQVLALDYRDKDSVQLYLGQIAEDRKQYPAALAAYGAVGDGEHYVMAQIRYATVLAKQDRMDDARKHLQQVNVSDTPQRVQLILAEAQLLREANQTQAAFDFLKQSLDAMPDQPDLLYDYAMVAEKLDRVDILEVNLRKLIALKPDNAHAYNALGYSLAERNVRLDEAFKYIDKALTLAPDDAFIIDSMGWVEFRLGHYQSSLKFMRRAYISRPDPDIAAHLGEVLWTMGERDEAKRVWQDAAKKNPDNEALTSTMKRFAAKQ